jgi:hypothetical protein
MRAHENAREDADHSNAIENKGKRDEAGKDELFFMDMR